MRTLVVLLTAHVVLLVLACTDFTAVSWMWGGKTFHWSFFTYSYRSGWGHDYVSGYGLAQALCYLAAYFAGIGAFSTAWRRYHLFGSAAATLLCVVGAVSFCIEASHWVASHHTSWIASFPLVMFALSVFIGLQLPWVRRRGVETSSPAYCESTANTA